MSCWLKKWLISANLAIWIVHVLEKKDYSWVPGEINSRFCSKTQSLNTDVLLVSGRHVGAHPDELQHGVSIQVSLDLGKTFLRISRLRQIVVTWIPARGFAYLPRFCTLSIERFESVLFRSILNGVTLKTSDTKQLLSFFLLKFPVIWRCPTNTLEHADWKGGKISTYLLFTFPGSTSVANQTTRWDNLQQQSCLLGVICNQSLLISSPV